MNDAREELFNEINMLLVKAECSLDIKEQLYIILHNYQIQNRCTEVAICNEDFNKQVIAKFLLSKTVAGSTKRTLEYYQAELNRIIDRIGKSVTEITSDDIRYYLAIRQAKDKVTRTTAGNECRVLSSFFNWMQREEILLRNPMNKVEHIKPEKKKKKAFTEIDVEKIRVACSNNRETAIVEMLLSTGCRVTELVNIRIADIETDKLIVHGKGEKDRIVYLNARAIMAIERYMAERKDNNPYLFCGGYYNSIKRYNSVKAGWYTHPELIGDGPTDKGSIEQRLRSIGKRAGVEKVHPHRFRRTCATFALRRGMPIEQVSKMLGHESVSTTMIYLDLSEEELQQAHKKYVV